MNKDKTQIKITAKASTGFTLFEILLSIFIFTIVITTIFSSYRAVFSSTDSINGKIASYEMANNCLNRMIMDIKAAYISQIPGYTPPAFNSPPDPYQMKGESQYAGSKTFPSFRFTSSAHLFPGKNMRTGIAEIIYYVQYIDNDEQYVLKRAENLPPYNKKFAFSNKDPILCEHLKSLEFIYYNFEGTEHESWDSESKEYKYATPSAMKIKLETGNDSVSLFYETMIDFPFYREEIK
ncbi:Uncharacterized protein dnl_07930 [Desulfonema limicola]|uniref:Type II secretion system protein J n=1 Tax=Desulfonema limicola TaxID=45656 RepID=A0A975GEX0_9BACT|nr:hypothetical protein [Desulfonema limicola]QTA78569.1 Uncharacterized protein dnl_07930 [Desulfonema limicola]